MKFGVTKAYGVGIIGYSIGRAHAHGWQGVGEVYHPAKALPKLVAIAGRSKDRLETEVQRYGFSRSYSDWRNLVKDKEVDIVDNCAPPYVHHDACIAAAEAGKHVICEKPMARSAKEAKEMLQAVEKAGVANMVGYNYRFVSAVALAKQMITEGKLGKIYYYRGSYLNAAADYHRSDTPFDWHHSSDLGGNGALWDLGTHAIDLARFLAGEIASVAGVVRTFIPGRQVDDAIAASVEFEGGAIGTIEATRVTLGHKNALQWELNGTKGSISFEVERLNELQVFRSGGRARGFETVLVTEPAEHDHILHARTLRHRFVGGLLELHDLATALEAVRGDEHLRLAVLQTRGDRLRAEPREARRVDRGDAQDGERRDDRLRRHRQQNADAVAAAHAESRQRVRETVHLARELGVGQRAGVPVGGSDVAFVVDIAALLRHGNR